MHPAKLNFDAKIGFIVANDHQLPSVVSPKQLCALVHVRGTQEVGTP